MIDWSGPLDSSRSLQTSSAISFVISLYLILQILKDFLSKNLQHASKRDLRQGFDYNYSTNMWSISINKSLWIMNIIVINFVLKILCANGSNFLLNFNKKNYVFFINSWISITFSKQDQRNPSLTPLAYTLFIFANYRMHIPLFLSISIGLFYPPLLDSSFFFALVTRQHRTGQK